MLVMYGFHPEEPLAEEVGKRLRGYRSDRVETVRFRPSYMPDNIHHLPEEDSIRITLNGHREQRLFVKENFKTRFVLDLHETPIIIPQEKMACRQPNYQINFPGWNKQLEKTLNLLVKEYKEHMWIGGRSPRGFAGYHAAAIEYYSKIKTKAGLKTLSGMQGTKFAKDVIDYLLSHYLV